jgi:TIR domain
MHSLTSRTEVRDLFISYSSKDVGFVERLAKDLGSTGMKVWWDKMEMKVGDSLHKKIQDGITASAWLGIVLSPNSVSSPLG